LLRISLEKKELDIEKESSNVEEVIIDAIEHVNLILEDREGQITTILKLRETVLMNDVHFTNVIVNVLENAIKLLMYQILMCIQKILKI
jgi:two-component system phosphate regulon sensor histidine kinase PhoR